MKLNALKDTYFVFKFSLNNLRLEVFDVDQGTFNTSHKFQKEMENKEEDIEEIADEVSTNEMQGSSILSMD